MNDDELFKQAMNGVKPLSNKNDKVTHTIKILDKETTKNRQQAAEASGIKDHNFLSLDHIAPVKSDDLLDYKKDGVQSGVYKNLRTGKYEVQSVLNLRGFSVTEARVKLFNYLEASHKDNIRTLLIQHGKGKDGAAHMKSCVNAWLKEFSYVLAFHSAQPFHGGLGATYALLKKNDEAKLTNREIHQKRSAKP